MTRFEHEVEAWTCDLGYGWRNILRSQATKRQASTTTTKRLHGFPRSAKVGTGRTNLRHGSAKLTIQPKSDQISVSQSDLARGICWLAWGDFEIVSLLTKVSDDTAGAKSGEY